MSELSDKLRRIAATRPGDPIPTELDRPNGWGEQLSALLVEAADALDRTAEFPDVLLPRLDDPARAAEAPRMMRPDELRMAGAKPIASINREQIEASGAEWGPQPPLAPPELLQVLVDTLSPVTAVSADSVVSALIQALAANGYEITLVEDRLKVEQLIASVQDQVVKLIAENAEIGGDRNERRQAILAGVEVAGEIGVMCRLARVCDFEQSRAWINGELARGTPASRRLTVAVDAAAFILAQAVLSVKERGMATRQVTANVVKALHQHMHQVASGKPPTAVHLVKGDGS